MTKPPVKKKNPALGRGLSALLDDAADINVKNNDDISAGSVAMIPINAIDPNPFQPRTDFEPRALEELASSISVHGLIQPVTVRKMGFDKYQLISGERRTKAANMAGLSQIPAYVRTSNDQGMLEMALIENIQRSELNAIEIALSYQRLMEECNLKQAELGERVGKERSTVTNYLRLLRLPDSIQLGVKKGTIGMGHARALINIENTEIQEHLYQIIVNYNLSVRDIEKTSKLSSNIILGLAIGNIDYEQTLAIQNANKEIQNEVYQLTVDQNLTDKQIRQISNLPRNIIQSGIANDITLNDLFILSRVDDEERVSELFEKAIKGELTTKDIEPPIDLLSQSKDSLGYNPTGGTDWNPELDRISESFSEKLKAAVHLKNGVSGKGKIIISYKNREDLERILDLIQS